MTSDQLQAQGILSWMDGRNFTWELTRLWRTVSGFVFNWVAHLITQLYPVDLFISLFRAVLDSIDLTNKLE
ncbi:hypothetical protein CEP53_008803 [Fusarium sp. AF-6]|nr:hypothetical protein CEP53_008803 [Fusarium sp. AF-6]